jgi:hypothetical protein
MSKHIHTYKYKKLSQGTLKRKPLIVKVWLWGIYISYNTKKSIGGFALSRNAGVTIVDTKSNAFRRKHPKA